MMTMMMKFLLLSNVLNYHQKTRNTMRGIEEEEEEEEEEGKDMRYNDVY